MTSTANSYYAPSDDDFSLKKFVVYSGALHALAALAIAASIYFNFHGNQWAGEGGYLGGTKVSLVSSAGIPMPRPIVPTESRVVDPTQGLHEIEPPKIDPTPVDATKLPQFNKDKPLPPSHKSKTFEDKTPPPKNAVPYGGGGSPDIPTGYSANPGGSSGMAIQGQGGGDFATRYGWYVSAVKRKLDSNWDRNTIDPAVRAAHRAKATVQFTIMRDGSIKGLKIYQTGGNLSLDNSGLRAVMSSGSMPALPSDYSYSEVTVIFDFDTGADK
jgi:outer membrane biosynthesis protein TonB